MPQNKKSRKSKKKKPLPHGWEVHPSKTYPDRVYFYNTITKCSSWENPCEVSKTSIKRTSDELSILSTGSSSVAKLSKSSKRKRKRLHSTINESQEKFPGLQNDKTNAKDIEDYDEDQDHYFENISLNTHTSTFSKGNSPPGSPECPEFISNLTDSDSSKSNLLLEHSSTKQLWKHFTSPPTKNGKDSIALSDLGPSTSKNTSTNGIDFEINKEKNNFSSDSSFYNSGSAILKGSKCHKKSSETHIRERQGHRDFTFPSNSGEKFCSKKTIKNISFKKTDKTPAQTRLLKLRKEISELPINDVNDALNKTPAQRHLLKLRKQLSNVSKFIEVPPKNVSSDKKLENLNNLKQNLKSVKKDRFRENKPINNVYTKETEFQTNGIEQGTDFNSDTFIEEMDWEPTSDELVVKNINDFRLKQDITKEAHSDLNFHFDGNGQMLPSAPSCCILVLDTNILISCLSFIRELRDTEIPGEGYPILYIPWRVLQELDHLKIPKIHALKEELRMKVRKAISFLNDCFKTKHPRCKGQSFQEYEKMVNIKPCAPDDEILQTCIELKKLHFDKKLILLTNDKNLESKANVNDVEVCNKERFNKKYLSCPNGYGSLDTLEKLTSANDIKVDNFVCHLKNVLKNVIPLVVETELKAAFNGDWLKVVFRKPPWTLQDALDCFIKHWRSVFYILVCKETLIVAEKLYKKLFNSEPDTMKDVREVINISQTFIEFIGKAYKPNRVYMGSINTARRHLCRLLEESTKDLSSQRDNPVQTQSHTQSHPETHPQSHPQNLSQSHSQLTPEPQSETYEFGQVKALFRGIWDSLRSYCCSVSDIINGSSLNVNMSLPEIKLKLTSIINDVSELIVNVENILEINISYVNEHPAILHLSNFLIKTLPLLPPEMHTELPKYLTLFCSNLEGRTLLSKSLRDFRDFERDLKKANECFDVKYGTV